MAWPGCVGETAGRKSSQMSNHRLFNDVVFTKSKQQNKFVSAARPGKPGKLGGGNLFVSLWWLSGLGLTAGPSVL